MPGFQTGPLDAKGAAAAAKAANAHAKALRPWYRKKRFALLAMLAILLIVIIAVASGGKPKSAKGPSPTSPGNKTPAGCAMSPSAYPDQQSTDCVALPNNTASLAGTVVRVITNTCGCTT
jgi:hypothetical protein